MVTGRRKPEENFKWAYVQFLQLLARSVGSCSQLHLAAVSFTRTAVMPCPPLPCFSRVFPESPLSDEMTARRPAAAGSATTKPGEEEAGPTVVRRQNAAGKSPRVSGEKRKENQDRVYAK